MIADGPPHRPGDGLGSLRKVGAARSGSGSLARVTIRRVLPEGAYLAVVTVLTVVATSDPNDFRPWAWTATLVLCLPAVIATAPVLYVITSSAWNLTGADNGGTAWPVTAAYVFVMVLTAVLNVIALRLASDRRRRRRSLRLAAP